MSLGDSMNRVFKSNGVYIKRYLTDAEKSLLAIVSYFKDKEHGLGNTEDFGNLMMDSAISKTVTKLLEDVNNDFEATYVLIQIESYI